MSALAKLMEAAELLEEQGVASAPNLLPPLLEATRAGSTLGEICGGLRQVWGEYRPPQLV